MWFFGPNIFDAIINGEMEKVRDILERGTKALQRRTVFLLYTMPCITRRKRGI